MIHTTPDLEITLLLLGGGIFLLCIIVLFLTRRRRQGSHGASSSFTLDPSRPPLRVRKVPFTNPEDPAHPGQSTGVTTGQEEIDCINGRKDLPGSLAALARKYSLDEITLATADGLLLASSGNAPPPETIARYAGMFAENIHPRPPGIILFGLEHKGSLLLGIARVSALLVQEPDPHMVRETKDILNRWI